MIIGIPKEIKPHEYRVGATPAAVADLVARGNTVYVEHGAGMGAGFPDKAYQNAGAILENAKNTYEKADLIYKVKELFPEEFHYMNKGKILYTYIHSNAHQDQTEALMESNCTSIAYEDVDDKNGKFPMLKPMSELAGKGGFLAALHFSQAVFGGNGLLLSNVCGTKAPVVTVIGCGCSGLGAAELAASFGNEVRMLDVSIETMEAARRELPSNVSFLFSNRDNLLNCLKDSDVLINCILWDKTRKDHLVSREDLKLMKPGAIIVDVACDDGGAIETCRSTNHEEPIYTEEGIIHYCVDNIPSSFSNTASITLCSATLPCLHEICKKGVEQALKDNKHLRRGLTTYNGKLTLEETARKLQIPYTSAEEALGMK